MATIVDFTFLLNAWFSIEIKRPGLYDRGTVRHIKLVRLGMTVHCPVPRSAAG